MTYISVEMNKERRSFLRRAVGMLLAPLGVGLGVSTTAYVARGEVENPSLFLYQLSLKPLRHVGMRFQYIGRTYEVVTVTCLGWRRDTNGRRSKEYMYGATWVSESNRELIYDGYVVDKRGHKWAKWRLGATYLRRV